MSAALMMNAEAVRIGQCFSGPPDTPDRGGGRDAPAPGP